MRAGQYATVKQIVASHHRDLGRLQRQATDRQRRIVRDAFLNVKKEIDGMGFASASMGSWTHAHRMAVMMLVGDAYRKVYAHGQGAFVDDVATTSLAAQQNLAVFLSTLDKKHHGVVSSLRFDTLQWWDQTNQAIGAVRLREYQQSFQRYGAKAVTKVENAIAAATLQQKTWREMRGDVWKAVAGTVEGEQWKIDRIIRTELSAAYNGTTLAALHEEDSREDRMLKKLVATFDRRTGKDSVLLHGQTKKLEEPFYDAVRAKYYQAPPNRPNDRETVVGWRESYGEILDDPYENTQRLQVQVPLRAPELAAGPPPALLMKPVSSNLGEMSLAQAAKAIGLQRHTLHHAHLGGHLKTTLKIPAGKSKAIPMVDAVDLEDFRKYYLSKQYGIAGPVSPPAPLVAPPLPKPKPAMPSLPKPTETVLGLDAPEALVQRGGGSVFSLGGETYVYQGETLHKGVRWIDTDRGLIQIPNQGKVKIYGADDATKLKPSAKGPALTELDVDDVEVGDLWLDMLPGTEHDKWRYPIRIDKIEELEPGKRKIWLEDGSGRTISGKEWIRKKADHDAYRSDVEKLLPKGSTIEESIELGELDFDLVDVPEFDTHAKLAKWMEDHHGIDFDLSGYDLDLARQIAQRVASRSKRFAYMRSQVEVKTIKPKPGGVMTAQTNRDIAKIEFNDQISSTAAWAAKWDADGIKDWGVFAKKPTPWSVSKHVDKNIKAAITTDHEIAHNLHYGVWRSAAQGDGLAVYIREEWTKLIAKHQANPAEFVAGLSEYAASGWTKGSVSGAELWAESVAAIWNGQAARVPLEARRLLHLAMRHNDEALKIAKAKQGVKLTAAEKKLPAKPPSKPPVAAEPVEPSIPAPPTEAADVLELDLKQDIYDLNEAKKAIDVPYGSIQGAVKSGKLPSKSVPKLDKQGKQMIGHKTGEPLMVYEIKADDLKAYAQAYHAQKGKAVKWKGDALPEPPKGVPELPTELPTKLPTKPPAPIVKAEPIPPPPSSPASGFSKQVYDLNDVKKEFGVPYGTVQGAVKSGKLPAKAIPKLDKNGKQVIGPKTGEPLFTYEIKAEDLEAWLKEKKPSALPTIAKPVPKPAPKAVPKGADLTDVQVGDWLEVDDDDVASMFGITKGTKLQAIKVTKFDSGSIDVQFSNGKSWNLLDPEDTSFFKKTIAPKVKPPVVKPLPDVPKPAPIVAEPTIIEGDAIDVFKDIEIGDTVWVEYDIAIIVKEKKFGGSLVGESLKSGISQEFKLDSYDAIKIVKAPKVPVPAPGLKLSQSTYSVAEAKKATGIPYGSIVSGLKSGKLPGTEIAGKWVIKGADLEDWAAKKLATKAVKVVDAPAPVVVAPKPVTKLPKGEVVAGKLEDVWAHVEPGDWIDTGSSLVKVVKVNPDAGDFEGFVHVGKTSKPKGYKGYALNKKSEVHLIKDGDPVDGLSETDLQIAAAKQKKTIDAMKKGIEEPAIPPPPKLPTAAEIEVKDTIDTTGWKQTGPQRGSNDGGLYQAPDGQEWYVKTPKGRADKYPEASPEELVRNEVLAAELYKAAGIEVPEVRIALRDGKVSIASKIIDGLKTDAELLKSGIPGVYDGFAVDAWLGNWDVVGMGFDNMLIKGGKAIRVDTGGALRFRAQGGPKGTAFGDEVTELETLRNAGTNSQSAAVFANMSDEQLIASMDRVLAIDDNAVKKLVEHFGPKDMKERDELHRKLVARKADIAKKRTELVKNLAGKKEAERLDAIARKEAAERIRKMREEGKIPLHGQSWERIHADKQNKVVDAFFRSTEALAKSPVGKAGHAAFKPTSFLDNSTGRSAAAESRAVFEKTYPKWMHEIFRDASSSWSSSSVGGSADLFHAMSVRFGISDAKHVSIRGRVSGRMRVASYDIDLNTGAVTHGGKTIGNIDDAFAAFYGHTQAVLQSQGITTIRAYRGVNGQLSRDLEGAVRGKTGARQHIVVSDPGASWSDSPMAAKNFSQRIRTETGGTETHYTILTREADAAEVIADRRASPYSIGLSDENEYILAGDNRRVVAYAEVDDLGIEHQGLGDGRKPYQAMVFEVENAGDKTAGATEAMRRLDRAATPILPTARPRLKVATKTIPSKAK